MAAILFAMPIVWHIKLCMLLVITAGVLYAVAQYALLLMPRSVIAIAITQQNKLHITYQHGQEIGDLSVCGETVVTPYLTVIRLQQNNASGLRRVFKINIVVMPDSAEAASFRKLRIWLRWGIKPV